MKSRSMRYVATGVIVAGLALITGCSHNGVLAPAAAPLVSTSTPTTSTTAPGNTRNGVVLSDELSRSCAIDVGNVQTAPKFDFDRSILDADDRSVLAQVARCVTTGPLKGRALHLVGRADPRGEEEYNMALGSSRAASVSQYLSTLGVAKSQITQSSRGKLDATGYDDATWRLDRRVDID
jgi:peptidoglycan-associated lipoprotein